MNQDPSEGPVNILIVDDRPSNLVSLQAILDRPDYRVVSASSGEEALGKVLREDFAVILLDVAMPSLDGVETARLLKQRDRSRHIPILFVTASVYDMESIVRAYHAGAVDYLQKPVEPFLVRAKVAVFVELYRQRQQIERQARLLRQSERREQELRMRQREESRRHFLDDASSVLLGSLEVDETIRAVPGLVVPAMAEAAVVYAHDEGGLREVGVAATEGRASTVSEAFRSLEGPASDGDGHLLRQAVMHGEARIIDPGEGARIESLASSREELEALRRLTIGSLLVVPLRARGRVRGGLLMTRRRESPMFSSEDLYLAEELGRRTAIALDNAKLYADARAAVEVRDEFLSIASHELRTPLTALRLHLQALDRAVSSIGDGRSPEGLHGKVSRSLRQVERLGRLVDSLLDVSRITTGRLALDPEPLDLEELAREVVDRWRDEAVRTGAELRLEVDGPAPGRWDKLRVEQVLDNLVANALKYAPGAPVEVTVSGRGALATVQVRDHGMGIPAEDLERIFGRFERAVPVRHYGGLGLGLYIARQIVEAHGGNIRAESSARGSTFTVELPRRAAAELAQPVAR